MIKRAPANITTLVLAIIPSRPYGASTNYVAGVSLRIINIKRGCGNDLLIFFSAHFLRVIRAIMVRSNVHRRPIIIM